MEVNIIEEAGYNSALYGFSLSYKDRAVRPGDWMCSTLFEVRCPEEYLDVSCDDCPLKQKYTQTAKTATANAGRDGGHNKFLEHIMTWIDIEASLEFWKQFDTYRVGVSKQSESSMHTLDKRDITIEDFDLTEEELLAEFDNDFFDVQRLLDTYIEHINELPSRTKSKLLPQGYLQRREVVLSYKVLRHIINQRIGHKLPEWKQFIDSIYNQVEHPELLPKRV